MPIDPSAQRKIQSLGDEITQLHKDHEDQVSAQADQVKKQVETLKAKKDQILNAQKKRAAATNQSANNNNSTASVSSHHDTGLSTANEQVDVTPAVEAMLNEKLAAGGFNYEKEINDKLKKMGKADKDSTTAGSSADAPDAKFNHNGKEHHLEVKQNSKAMFGQIELHHDGKKWDISERSKKKYPHTTRAIQDTGFLHKVNKQWDKPTGDYESDLQKGNVYHTHHDAEPIKAHYGKDRKTDYIQIGGGHGFYHTGKDSAKLGSPELHGKATLRARMKARGTDRKTGKRKYGALVVMGLKDADKSHHNLDESIQKKWIDDALNGHAIYESVLNPKDPHGDYKAKSKALLDLSLNKDVDQKAVTQRKLDLDKEYAKHTVKEAHKIGDKVTIHKGPADVVGKTGTVGEIRNGAFKGASKTYTIDHEKGSIQLKSTHFKALREDMVQLRKMLDKHSQLALAANKNGDDEKVKHHQRMMNKVKDKMEKMVREDTTVWSTPLHEDAKSFVDAFWSGQQEEPKKNPYAEGTKEYTEYENGYMQGVMKRRVMQTESRGHSLLSTFFKNRETANKFATGQSHIPTPQERKEAEKKEVKESAPVAPAPHIHRIAVTVSDPDHPAVTKRDETQQKFVRVTHHTDNKDEAIARGKKHFAKKGWKVHDAHHVGMVHESTISESDAAWAASQEKQKEKRLTNKDQNTLAKLRAMMAKEKKPIKEGAYEDAEENKKSADAAKKQGDMFAHHLHMADHHDNLAQWHYEKGRNNVGDSHMAKAEKHQEEASKLKEEVAANNVGGGSIAGTQGDAGKKAKLMSEPLKRKPLPKFKTYVSQEHDQA